MSTVAGPTSPTSTLVVIMNCGLSLIRRGTTMILMYIYEPDCILHTLNLGE